MQQSHAKYERLCFQRDLIERLAKASGTSILQQASVNDLEAQRFKENLDSFSGTLFVSNKKRAAKSDSLILKGKCVACIYTFGNDELDEELEIRWKAVERDLDHELTTLTFYKVEDPIIQGASAFFRAASSSHSTALEMRPEIERMIAQHVQPGESATVLASNNAALFFTFLADGKPVGTMAAIHAGKGLLGFASDLSFLNLKCKYGDDETYIELFVVSDELFM